MNEVNNYISNLFSTNNPVIYSFLFTALIVGFIIILFFKVIIPMRLKFYQEKQNLILEQTKLTALFSELDPDPSIRCNLKGEIIQTNEATRSHCHLAVKGRMSLMTKYGINEEA